MTWRTYPPRKATGCILRHEIIANETAQGPFYNVEFLSIHTIGDSLFALAMSQDSNQSTLLSIDKQKLTIEKIADLTRYGRLGTANVAAGDQIYFTTTQEDKANDLYSIDVKSMLVKKAGSVHHLPLLNNLISYNGNLYSLYWNNNFPESQTISILQLGLDGKVIKDTRVEQSSASATPFAATLVPETNAIAFSYGDSMGMMGHKTHACVYDIATSKITQQENKIDTPYLLVNIPN